MYLLLFEFFTYLFLKAKKKDPCEPGWWGFLSWQIKKEQTTPSIGNFYYLQDAKAGLEFQWDQDSGFRRLKWFQKENKRRFRNTIYFFLRPSDRRTDLLKINLAIPKTFKSTLKNEKISFCKVRIGGFENRTKCLEDIPADIEINTDESGLRSLDIYPYSPIPSNKDSYAIVLKVFNP